MSETARRMLVRGVAAAHAGDSAEAVRYLERVLYNDPTRDQMIEAHLWLSRLTSDEHAQREHLEDVLAADPVNAEARRALAILEGHLDPKDVIDPDRLVEGPAGADTSPARPAQSQRLTCPMCAGRVRFEPGKSWVQCQYCGHREPLTSALHSHAPLAESDFFVALATTKGHNLPASQRLLRCQGCNASLLVTGALATHCPYCGSAHIVEQEGKTTVRPEGIVPFVLDDAAALTAFRQWLDDKLGNQAKQARTTRPRGIYMPVWTFDLMGEIGWCSDQSDARDGTYGFSSALSRGHAWIDQNAKDQPGSRAESRQYVMFDGLAVPATHSVPFTLRAIFSSFDLAGAAPYDAALLSDWTAEVYSIRVSDASLVARRQALELAQADRRAQAATSLGGIGQKTPVFSRSLAVQAYKLILVPIWLANYRLAGSAYTVAINGHNGRAFGETPPRGLTRLIRSWLGL